MERLLDYELKQSIRHRRFVSLVILTVNGNSNKLKKILEGIVRDSDPIFYLPECLAVLMGETENDGAQHAIERYRKAIGGTVKVKYAVASFPEDGKAVGELMNAANRRLDIAKASDSGPVNAEG